MLENLIVALIVALAALYAGGKYLPLPWRKKASGCGSGCDTCGSCDEPKKTDPRVIKLHKAES
jgi:hypothetical protein